MTKECFLQGRLFPAGHSLRYYSSAVVLSAVLALSGKADFLQWQSHVKPAGLT